MYLRKLGLLLLILLILPLSSYAVDPLDSSRNDTLTDIGTSITPQLSAPSLNQTSGSQSYKEGEVLVRFRDNPLIQDGAADSRVARAHSLVGGEVERDFSSLGLDGVQLVQLPENQTVESAIDGYRSDPNVLYAEPNYLIKADNIQNDPRFNEQWGLSNIGQTISGQAGVSGADIDVQPAWGSSTGSSSVIVAVIDTGVDYRHEDLSANIWTNTAEIPGNGIDDDHNGYVDDVHGYDFHNKDGDPMDDDGHGTHCAGILGAVTNNGIGVSGTMHHVRIMPLKFMGADGKGSTADAIKCFLYARQMGAQIISCSWGVDGNSLALKDAMAANSALIVCTAGNDGINTDNTPHYPSSYDLPQIVSVAATDNQDRLASFSNYGISSVDVGAPGVNILSTVPGGYRYMSGTSMATPFVSGVAGLILSRESSLSPAQIRARIVSSTDPVTGLCGRCASGGRIDAARALGLASVPTATPTVTLTATITPGVEAPYRPHTLPARVEAEDYDLGGEGVANHDTTPGNQGGQYRTDDVDIETIPAGGYNVGYIRDGEWLTYTVEAPSTSAYSATFRVASWSTGRSITVSLDGAPATTVPVAMTGSYTTYTLSTVPISMTRGTHKIGLTFNGDGQNLDYFDLISGSPVPTTVPTTAPTIALPTDAITVPTATTTVVTTPTPTLPSTVSSIKLVPGATGIPTSTNHNSRYDDLNGNGGLDFNDVVLFFNQMDWIAANEPVVAFDFNGNDRVDFADVVWLFNNL